MYKVWYLCILDTRQVIFFIIFVFLCVFFSFYFNRSAGERQEPPWYWACSQQAWNLKPDPWTNTKRRTGSLRPDLCISSPNHVQLGCLRSCVSCAPTPPPWPKRGASFPQKCKNHIWYFLSLALKQRLLLSVCPGSVEKTKSTQTYL